VPDRYLPEILDAPEVAVLADRAQEEAGDGERLGNHLGDPAIKPPEMEVGRTVGQQPRLDRFQVVVEEEERDSVRGVKRLEAFVTYARELPDMCHGTKTAR